MRRLVSSLGYQPWLMTEREVVRTVRTTCHPRARQLAWSCGMCPAFPAYWSILRIPRKPRTLRNDPFESLHLPPALASLRGGSAPPPPPPSSSSLHQRQHATDPRPLVETPTVTSDYLMMSAANEADRPKSTNSMGGRAARTVKQRSSKACQTCRKRKVRCDVTANGGCCTNCRLDRQECILVASRRGRHQRDRRSSMAMATLGDTHSPPMPARPATPSSMSTSTSNVGRASLSVPACVTFEEESDQLPTSNVAGNHRATEQTDTIAYAKHIPLEPSPDLFPYDHSPMSEALPSFIAPLSTRMSPDDLAFIARKGAMTIPEPELRDEILRSYLFSVHPFMPMLDAKPFLHAILKGQRQHQVSLLLFQAVMFAGLHSLPLTVIRRLGFQTTKHARQIFFGRVKCLYDFEVEANDIAVLQSLLLMSSWYGKWDERRHTWHFTGLAYDLARTIGLHREPASKHLSDKDRSFRRRLWWSLYIRDRLLALGTRRPMRISDRDCNVAMLVLEDFDLDPPQDPYVGHSLLQDAEGNTATALMCIELAKLCVLIGNIVSSRYTTLSDQPDVPHSVMMVSRRHEGHDIELQRCETDLSAWFGGLTTNVRQATSSDFLNQPGSCSQVHWSMLHLTYYTAVNVLHRAQALQPSADDPGAQAVQKSSRLKVKDAACNITKLSMSMLRKDQVRYLGTLGVTALVAACLSHLLDVQSAHEDVRDASTFRLHQSLQALGALRGIWRSADAANTFIGSIARKAGVDTLPQATSDLEDTTEFSANSLLGAAVNGQSQTTLQGGSSASTADWSWPNDHGSALFSDSQTSPFTASVQSAIHARRPQTSRDSRGHENMAAIGTSDPLSTAVLSTSDRAAASVERTEARPLADSNTQSIETMFSGPSDPAGDLTIFDWNDELSSVMAMEPTSFNFDFYSNALGSM